MIMRDAFLKAFATEAGKVLATAVTGLAVGLGVHLAFTDPIGFVLFATYVLLVLWKASS